MCIATAIIVFGAVAMLLWRHSPSVLKIIVILGLIAIFYPLIWISEFLKGRI